MMKNKTFLCVMLAAAMLLCSGCAIGKSYDMANTEAPAAEAFMEEAIAEDSIEMEYAADTGAGVFGSAPEAQKGNYGNHKIISTYSIEMNTDEFDLHLQMLQDEAIRLGGYIQSSNVSGTKPETYNDYGRYASYSFRIPSDRAEEFVEYTKGTGEITYSNCDTEDVTLSYYDTETRLQVLRTQLERLQSILVETDNLADIIELEQAISETTLEIEQYTTQLRRYDDLIDYTTVHVSVSENRLTTGPAAKETLGQRISSGFAESMAGLGVFLEDALVWLICAIPALLLIAAMVLVAIVLFRIIWRQTAKGRERRAKKAEQRRARMAEIEQRNKENK